jgi:beta-lactamase regulating signal transducer with metallopeptidase domain
MNSFVETLNQWGGNFSGFAWPMLWQASLLIVALLVFDFLFRRRVRASIRYGLWLIVLVKLCLPPTFALPTSPAWWLHKTPKPVTHKIETHYVVTYDDTPMPEMASAPPQVFVPPKATLNFAAWLLVVSASVSLALLLWLLVRWWQITRQVRRAKTSERLTALADAAQKVVGIKFNVTVKLTPNSMSPAVCGLFRPVILIPQALAENFSDEQLRAVLLHELIHLRRRDVWLNFLQALLQIIYWWHPLVWIANARIRRGREEAVDDAVMFALRDEAEAYAPTLLEVAKLALNRPLASLGLVGILESRHALRQRIERLVDFQQPRQAGLTLASLLGILAFTAVAVPMGGAPSPAENQAVIATTAVEEQSLTVKVNPEVFIRNVKGQANRTLHAAADAYTDILLDILRGEGVDCNPPHGLAFNTKTGEITTQNIPDQLDVFRQAIEQLNRADGKCELPLRNSILYRKSILIESRTYQMSAADFGKITSGLKSYRDSEGGAAWWPVPPEKFNPLIGIVESSGLQPILRPRIQTSSGMSAQFYIGNATNYFEFDCIPFAKDGFVDLTMQSTVVTGPPAKAAFTNQFNTKASAEDHGGIMVRMENLAGYAGSNLVTFIRMEIVTNTARYAERLQTIIKRAPEDAAGQPKNLVKQIDHIQLDQFGPFNGLSLGEVVGKMVKITGITMSVEDSSILNLPINMPLSLENVNLHDALEAVVLHAATPIKYFILNGQVTFTIKDQPPTLFTRTFKVDTNSFLIALRNGTRVPTNRPSLMARNVFSQAGVDMESPKGKSVFYIDRLGLLYVKATEADLDKIEKVILELNIVPPQIHIKARFFEVPKGTWGTFEKFSVVTNGIVSQPAGVSTVVGILTSENAKTVMQHLQDQTGIETLAEPEATSTSGRQIQMRATQMINVVTNFMFQETGTNPFESLQTKTVETGPILDVVPYVLADGYTINLTVIPSVTEFLGYDPTTNTTTAYTAAGEKVDVPKILPNFRVRQVVANVNLWDDQTVVLGKLEIHSTAGSKPQIPEKELLVFITATLVDPAGNRVHANNDLPFAQKGVPQQPPKKLPLF